MVFILLNQMNSYYGFLREFLLNVLCNVLYVIIKCIVKKVHFFSIHKIKLLNFA